LHPFADVHRRPALLLAKDGGQGGDEELVRCRSGRIVRIRHGLLGIEEVAATADAYHAA
jgi:hypothetical protein